MTVMLIGCSDNPPYYVPDYSTVPEARDTTTAADKIKMDNGLILYVHQPGEGDFTVVERDYVSVRYTGRLITGEVFDSTWKDGRTAPTSPRSVQSFINGFRQGLMGMREGEVRTFVIPPHLGYGNQGQSTEKVFIPPNSVLIFDVELVSILD